MALRLVAGFNIGTPGWVTGNPGIRFADAVGGAPAIVSVDGRNWLEISAAAGSENLSWTTDTLGTNQTRIAVGVRVRFQTTVPDAQILAQIDFAAGISVILTVDASDQLIAGFEGGNTQVGPTLSADTDYYVELHLDVSANPHVLDWVVNTTAQTQVTQGQAASTIAALRLGTTNSETWTGLFTDLVVWTDTADIAFPIGKHRVPTAVVDAGGTWALTGSAASFSTFTANGTLDTSFTVTEARDRTDDWPPTIGASADGWVQDAIAAADLLSSPMTAPTLAAGETVTGLRAMVVGWATSTTGTNIRFDAFNGSVAETFFALGDPNFDNSTTVPAWVCAMLTAGNYDTQAELDALELRGGWGTDANPDAGVHGWAVAIAIKEATGDAAVTPAAIAVTVALPASTRSVGVAPAVLAAVATLPKADVGVGAAPAAIAAATAMAKANIGVGATSAPVAAVAALPLAAAGQGGDATVTPAAIPAVAALPQAAVGVGAAPAVISVLVDISLAGGVDVGVAPAVLPAVIALPQATPDGGGGSATATPSPIALVAAVLQSALSVGAAPAPIAAVASLPQAALAVGVTPAVVAAVAALLQPAVSVGAAPSPVAAVAALPQATPDVGGGNVTVTPAALAAVVALPQAAVSVGVRPAVIALAVALPTATIVVHAVAQPAAIALVATLPRPAVNVGVVPAPIAVVIAVLAPERVGPPFAANINPAGPIIVGVIVNETDEVVGATTRPGGMAGGIS